MSVPDHFAVNDAERVAAFVDRAGAADLVTSDGTQLIATLLPEIWDRQQSASGEPGLGRLLGHIALDNQQWSTTDTAVPALAIVHGPQAYVSPMWYRSTAETGRTVPTWNYVSVHFTGPVTFHRDPQWLRNVVTRLTDRYEGHRDPRWQLEDAPPPYIDGQLRGIVGVELTVNRVEAKEKLSQNRGQADRAGVIAGLRAEPGPDGAGVIADLMAARESSPA